MRDRLDRLLVSRGLARSRAQAQSLILAGSVTVEGVVATRVSELVEVGVVLGAEPDRYVSRGAHKLIGALDDLQLVVAGRALDAGSSTGGFTQVLLERGCSEVFAVDVGTDQLAPTLRTDPRVHLHERTNLRTLTAETLDGMVVEVLVADVSFISLTLLIEPFDAVLAPGADVVLMIKPQFEVGREQLGKGGVVREPERHAHAIELVTDRAARQGWQLHAVVPSQLPGASGNQEFFAHFTNPRRAPTGPPG